MPHGSHGKTLDDYFALGPDDVLTELIEGEFFVSPSPELRHQAAIAMLVTILTQQVRHRKLGWVIAAPADTVLSPRSVVHPDVMFLSTATLARAGKVLEGPPDLAVEFLSPSNPENDLDRKMKLYLKHGVPEYWIGDPAAKTIRVLEHGGQAWIERGTFKVGDIVRPVGLPGVVVPVSEVFSFPD